jgi:hypothetical protein
MTAYFSRGYLLELAGFPTLLFAIINSVHRESVTDFRQDNFSACSKVRLSRPVFSFADVHARAVYGAEECLLMMALL